MPFSGSITRSLSADRQLSGQVNLDGSIGDSYITKRTVSGILTVVGELVGTLPGVVTRLLEGVLSFSGQLSDNNAFQRTLQGLLSFIGLITTPLVDGLYYQIEDCIKKALTDTVNGILLSFYKTGGAISNNISDAEREYLLSQGMLAQNNQDMWHELYKSMGILGTITDQRHKFWCDPPT